MDTQRWLARSRSEWDRRAAIFDARSVANAQSDDRRRELDFVCAALGLQPGARVLDAGCGTGAFSIAFAQRGYSVDAIDLSPEMIAHARLHAEDANVEVRFSVGDLATLDAPDDVYDAIVSRVALQFSPHVRATLDAFERVATPSATLWLAVPGALSPVYRHSWQRFLVDEPEPINYLMPWELIQLLEASGWQVGEQWGSFDAIGPDAGNAAVDLEIEILPLPLQQAAATVWNLIASRPL